MYRAGHYGAALLAYAPLALALVAVGRRELAFVGAVGVLAVTPLPDYDQRIPLIEHRGITHTVAFAALVGGVLAGLGWAAGRRAGTPASAVGLAALGFAVGALAILAHLAADVVTPAGIRPFRPVSNRRYSLGWVRAANPVANYALLAAGLLASGGVAYVAGLVG